MQRRSGWKGPSERVGGGEGAQGKLLGTLVKERRVSREGNQGRERRVSKEGWKAAIGSKG